MSAPIIKVGTNMTMSYELITPERAKELLDSQGVNRNISKSTVIAYTNDILGDNWDTETSNSIAIDRDGILRDGQHRCMAIVKSGKAEPMWVCRNVAKNGIYDNNRRRSTRDQVQISSPDLEAIYRSNRYQTVAKAIINYGDGRRTVTAMEIISFTKEHKSDLDGFFMNLPKSFVSKISLSVVFLGMFTAYMSGVDMNDINDFYQILCTGMSTKEEAFPIIAYRNYLKDTPPGGVHTTTKEEITRCQFAINRYLNGSKTRRSISPKDFIYPMPYQNKKKN